MTCVTLAITLIAGVEEEKPMKISATLLSAFAFALTACGGESTNENEEEPVAEADTGAEAAMAPSEDALVEGTQYNATTILDCGFDSGPPTESCNAGVIRNWCGEAGSALVEIQKPDGFKRAIFFNGTEPFGADSAEADGSAGWDFETSREGDRVTIQFGPESYVIVDALIEGG